jgi:hypothetical protein
MFTSKNNDAETLDDVETTENVAENALESKRIRKPTTRYQGFWGHRPRG